MNNEEIAKKHGIKEGIPYFFSEECLKFYSKNDTELIETQTFGLMNLQFSGYDYDEDNKYYIKTNNTVKYEFYGKEYDLFEYEDCFTYYVFLCNDKLKKFRYITMEDYKDFHEDGVYVYKDKYYCHYYGYIKSLLFFNRNQYINIPGPGIVKDLKKPNATEFISKYFEVKDGHVYKRPNITEFYIDEDEAILIYFHNIYENIMKELFKIENPIVYKNTIEKDEEEVNNMNNMDESNKDVLKMYYLYGHDEFRDFCNKICRPEIFNNELLKNGEVRKNLKNNFWIYHEFNSSLKDPNTDFIEGEDFTFLIINAIKSLEYLLYKKIKDYKDFKNISKNNEITEKVMMDTMIYYIQNHNEMFKKFSEDEMSKNNYDSFIESYIKLLYFVKDECRNGYFHKHRIDKYNELCEKRNKVLEAIAKTIIILK